MAATEPAPPAGTQIGDTREGTRPATFQSFLRAPGVPTSTGRSKSFLGPLGRIEQLQPANSRIVVTAEDGAVIFGVDAPPMTFGHLVTVASLLFMLVMYCLMARLFLLGAGIELHALRTTGRLHESSTPLSWQGLVALVILMLSVAGLLAYGLIKVSTQILDVIGRWRVIATPNRIALRHSFMNLGITTVIDPKHVVMLKRRWSAMPGFDRYRSATTSLGDDDAEWLAQALLLLYPQMDRVVH